jgi:hypothetical protein
MAADWTAKSHADVDRWLETQRSWWATVIGIDAATPAAAKREAVETWRQSTRSVVDAQAGVLLSLLSEQADEAEQLLRRWTDAQRELLYGWLAVSGGSGKPGQSVQDAGQQMVESLRKAAEELVNSQAQWAKAWTEAQADARPQPSSPGT